jgi:hypothetical protein
MSLQSALCKPPDLSWMTEEERRAFWKRTLEEIRESRKDRTQGFQGLPDPVPACRPRPIRENTLNPRFESIYDPKDER